MRRRARKSAWTIALFASFGIHGVLAASLAMLPMPEKRRPETRVDVQILAEASMEAITANAQTAMPAEPDPLTLAGEAAGGADAAQPAHPDVTPLVAPDAAGVLDHERSSTASATVASSGEALEASEPDPLAVAATIPDETAKVPVESAEIAGATVDMAMLDARSSDAMDAPATASSPQTAEASPAARTEVVPARPAQTNPLGASFASSPHVAIATTPNLPGISAAALPTADAISTTANVPERARAVIGNGEARSVVASAVLPTQVAPGSSIAAAANFAEPTVSAELPVLNTPTMPSHAEAPRAPSNSPDAATDVRSTPAGILVPAGNLHIAQPAVTATAVANSTAHVVPASQTAISPVSSPRQTEAVSSSDPEAIGVATAPESSVSGSIELSASAGAIVLAPHSGASATISLPANDLALNVMASGSEASVQLAPMEIAPALSGTAEMPALAMETPARTEQMAMILPLLPSVPESVGRESNTRERVVQHLSTLGGEGCFLAMPEDNRETFIVTSFAARPGQLYRLGDEIKRATGIPVAAQTHTVSQDQCGALSLARSMSPSGVPSIGIHADSQTIASGEALSGQFPKPRLPFTTLLLVDHSGSVQRFRNLSDGSEGTIRFRTPMTRMGGAVTTPQLLVAIATDKPLHTIDTYDGMHADRYFSALADEIARDNVTVEFGVTHFFMR